MRKEKIMKTMSRYKYIIGFVCIFVIIFATLYVGIVVIDETFTHKHVREETNVIVDKYYSHGDPSSYYLIETQDNNTYCILDDGSGDAKILYDRIEIGNEYVLVLQDSGIEEPTQYSNILKVYNVTE